MAQQQLSPSAIVTQFNISGSIVDVQDNPYAPDDKYMKNPSDFGIAIFDFPAGYTLELGPIQKFTVFVRNPSSYTSTINISVLDKNLQTSVKSGGSIDIPGQSQMVIEMTWDANALSIKRSENVRIGINIDGTLDLGAVMWIAEVYQAETTAIMVQTRRVIVTHGYYQAQTMRAAEKLLAYPAQTIRRTNLQKVLQSQAVRKLTETANYTHQTMRSLSSMVYFDAQTERKASALLQLMSQVIRRLGIGVEITTQTLRKSTIQAIYAAQSKRKLSSVVNYGFQMSRKLFNIIIKVFQTLRNLILGKPDVYVDVSIESRPIECSVEYYTVNIDVKQRPVDFEVR